MFNLKFRRAHADESGRLDAIRRAAFAPVFASFRSILGDEIYDLAQRREDEAAPPPNARTRRRVSTSRSPACGCAKKL
jgi:hypothetical protein